MPRSSAAVDKAAPSEDIMNQTETRATFRGLPLTPEQDSEIRHYIHLRTRSGAAWDTPELKAMLHDMLEPPELDDEDGHSVEESVATEHSAALDDSGIDGGRSPA
jgi:hypothetical protein